MDKVVVKTGKIFQAGDYPDKKFKLDASELSSVVDRFTMPVPLDLNHKSSGLKRLDAKLGKLTKIWNDDQGQLFGRVEIPNWLNDTVCKDDDGKDLPLPVSCAFGPDKTIRKLALTDSPRVSDAAIFAAFSAAHPEEADALKEELVSIGSGELADEKQFSSELIKELVSFAKTSKQTHEGQSVIQQVHDILARAGAVCTPDTELHSASELAAIQTAHDELVAAGAVCRALKEGERPCTWFSSEMSDHTADANTKGDNMNSERLSIVNSILKFIDGDKATGAEEPKVFARGGSLEEPKPEAKTEEKMATVGTLEPTEFASPEVKALRAELDAEKKKTEKLIKDGIAAQSKILANEIIVGKHADEKQRGTIEAAFAQALVDDMDNPAEINFSTDKKGGRVETLKAVFSAKTIVPLTEETVKEDEVETLLSNEAAGKDDETKKRLEAVRERALKLAERKNQRLRK